MEREASENTSKCLNEETSVSIKDESPTAKIKKQIIGLKK